MTNWTREDLDRIGNAEEVRLASRRRDGSLRRPVTIWIVRHGDELYVRSVNGPSAAWYHAATASGEGRIEAGGFAREVTFVAVDSEPGDALDAEYRTKYRRYAASIIDHINGPDARSATIRLAPQ